MAERSHARHVVGVGAKFARESGQAGGDRFEEGVERAVRPERQIEQVRVIEGAHRVVPQVRGVRGRQGEAVEPGDRRGEVVELRRRETSRASVARFQRGGGREIGEHEHVGHGVVVDHCGEAGGERGVAGGEAIETGLGFRALHGRGEGGIFFHPGAGLLQDEAAAGQAGAPNAVHVARAGTLQGE